MGPKCGFLACQLEPKAGEATFPVGFIRDSDHPAPRDRLWHTPKRCDHGRHRSWCLGWCQGVAPLLEGKVLGSHPEMGEWAEYLYPRIYGKSRGQEARLKELEERVYSKRIQ